MDSERFWKLNDPRVCTESLGMKNGQMTIKVNGKQIDIMSLVKDYGTPLEIMMPFVVENRTKKLKVLFDNAIKKHKYDAKFIHCYPLKVSQRKEFIDQIVSVGGNLEVSTYNELCAVERLYETGKIKNDTMTVCNGIKEDSYFKKITEMRKKGYDVLFIVETENEFEKLLDLQEFKEIPIGIRLRIRIRTFGHWDASKPENRFGIEEDKAKLMLKRLSKNSSLVLKLLHYHIGSQIESEKVILRAVNEALHIYTELKKDFPSLDSIDIGGGFGIPYNKNKPLYNEERMIDRLIGISKEICSKNRVQCPNILVEAGRWTVAPGQMTVFKVICSKDIDFLTKAKKWYIVDSSFISDLPDTWAVYQDWWIVPVNNPNGSLEKVWLAGNSCDSDDKYVPKSPPFVRLPKLEGKDLYIAVLDTGAYQDSFSGVGGGHVCMLSEPCRILIEKSGAIRKIRDKQTPEEVRKLFGWDI